MFGKVVAIALSFSIFLSGCVTTSGPAGRPDSSVGPQVSSSYLKQEQDEVVAPIFKPKLDVIIPVFDPGIPEDSSESEEENIWPELRRAEANRFAYKLKIALEETGKFGAVRVTPDRTATGDLYVIGKIEKSNGEEVGIHVEVYDISEKKWLEESFEHTVDEGFYNIRNKGKDAYDPVFVKAANYIANELNEHDDKELADLKLLTEIRFGASFSEEAFGPYLNYDKQPSFLFWINQGEVSLAGLPSEDDPMMHRIRSVRVRDQLFVDRMQSHYESFSQNMDSSYQIWQEGSSLEVKATREARGKQVGQVILGVLLIAGAAYASSHNDNQHYDPAVTTAAVVAGIGGAMMLSKSVQTGEEAKFHEDALAELGESLDIEMGPQVVEFEKSTAKLTGDASEQFNQWRAFLKRIYMAESESAPDVKL